MASKNNQQTAQGGKTMLQAIHEKYEDKEEDGLDFVIFVAKGQPGKNDGGGLEVPRDLYLNESAITGVGDVDEVAKLCAEVSELHLAENNICQWEEVLRILGACPQLCLLNLYANPLASGVPEEEIWPEQRTFPGLRKLILNYTRLPWQTLRRLLLAFPNLSELHVSFNDYPAVDSAVFGELTFPHMEVLNINGNRFSTWTEVSKLGALFPGLKVLHMLDVPLGRVDEEGAAVGEHFPDLEVLSLRHAPLQDWPTLGKFRHLPRLTDIKLIGDIPLFKGLDEKKRRQFLLAYLPNISRLHGARFTDTEREDAERAFIRHFMGQEDKPDRVAELEARHGSLGALVDVDFKKPESVTVSIKLEGQSSVLQQVNLNWTAQEFKKKLQPLVKHPLRAFKLYHMPSFMPADVREISATNMMFPKRTLLRYHFEEGDEVMVVVTGTKPVPIRYTGLPGTKVKFSN